MEQLNYLHFILIYYLRASPFLVRYDYWFINKFIADATT